MCIEARMHSNGKSTKGKKRAKIKKKLKMRMRKVEYVGMTWRQTLYDWMSRWNFVCTKFSVRTHR